MGGHQCQLMTLERDLAAMSGCVRHLTILFQKFETALGFGFN